jgi:hypothetical protein
MHVVSLLNLLNNRNIARTSSGQETCMGTRLGRLPALAVLATLLGTTPLLSQARPDETRTADGYAHLSGFGEGVAAVVASRSPASTRVVQGFNGKVTLSTYRQPGIELVTASGGGGGKAYPVSLTIARPAYPLALGLRIGALRGAVEDALGAAAAGGGGGGKLVLKRTGGEGCDDPIVLSFRGKALTRVAWTWESCMD